LKTISVTIISEVLTEEGRKKLEELSNNEVDFEDLTCDNGRTREEYNSLGMKIPQSLIDKEQSYGKGFELDDEYYDTVFKP